MVGGGEMNTLYSAMRPTGKGTYFMKNIDASALTLLATTCASGTCPTIFKSDRGTYVIQGYAVNAAQAGVTLAHDELLIEIPSELLAGIVAQESAASGN
jgi:hypothetical protein